jgi:hypothetical protein
MKSSDESTSCASRAARRLPLRVLPIPEVAFNFAFEVEHITPAGREGRSVDENMALACRSCNLYKAAHTTAVDPETEIVVRLFDPRSESWPEHFAIDNISGVIVGISATGRATVAQLKMNSEFQLNARRHWMSLVLFP